MKEFLERLGKVWVPMTDPPETGTVPLDSGRLSDAELSEWLGKCTAWLAYAHSQLGIAEAQKTLVHKRFTRAANAKVIEGGVKQKTYDLQISEVMLNDPMLQRLEEEVTEQEARISLWNRMAKAYDSYVRLFSGEVDKRKWTREKGG